MSSREISSKIMAIWWPTFTFVALGLDHVIANMYFVPVAIFYGHPDIGVGLYIWKSLIPTTLGNIIGGGLFVGSVYWYLYLTGIGPHEIKFDLSGLDTAMEVGGPMGPRRRKSEQNSGDTIDVSRDQVLEGEEPETHPNHVSSIPSTGMKMTSGLGNELNAQTYAKPKAEVLAGGSEKV